MDDSLFLEKTAVLCVQRHVSMIGELCPESDLFKERVTGHAFRRSGAKERLERVFLSNFAEAERLARHSSSATWAYVEEAWEETPRQSLRLDDVSSVRSALSNVKTRMDNIGKS